MILKRAAIAIAAVALIATANVATAEGTDLYAPRPAEQVRQDLLKWLAPRRHQRKDRLEHPSTLGGQQHARPAAAGLRAVDSKL